MSREAREAAEPRRTNAAWLHALNGDGPRHAEALAELSGLVRSTIRRVIHGTLPEDQIDDLVQEALRHILRSKDSFRGASRFTTWATSLVTRVAFTALRRHRVRQGKTVSFEAVVAEANASSLYRPPAARGLGGQEDLRDALHQAIQEALTTKQRTAILAELHGIPTVEIASRMGTNQNALYKLVHDARKRLKKALLAEGITAEDLDRPTEEWPS